MMKLKMTQDLTNQVVPGCDMAGVVIGKGINVKKYDIGDEVYANIQDFNNTDEKPKQLGTLAQFIVVEENLVARKPKCLSFEEAASLPLAVQTSIERFKTGDFKKGGTMFVVGGAGGVGTLVLQLAKLLFGASYVVSSCSTPKVKFVKQFGADSTPKVRLIPIYNMSMVIWKKILIVSTSNSFIL